MNADLREGLDNERHRRPWPRRLLVALAVGLGLGVLSTGPWADGLHRLGIDLLLPVRHLLFGPLYPPTRSDAVVVAIDEETYRIPPFSETPKVAWTPMLARVLDAVDGAGAAVIGLDLIYPTSLDRPDLLPGYDKPLLRSLFRVGRSGRLILGQVRLSQQSIAPYKGQRMAVGGPANIRPLNLLLDADGVVRRYPGAFADEAAGRVASFARELAERAGRVSGKPADFLINYNTGAHDIPTYSLADMNACAENGKSEFFERHFRNRVVIFGSVLDVEDRRIPAKRFITGGGPAQRSERCHIGYDDARFGEIVERRSLPGVFIHAAAVNTLVKGNALKLLSPAWTFVATSGGGTILALAFFLFPPLSGAVAGLGILALEGGLAALLFRNGLVAPVVALGLGGGAVYTAVYAFRFVIEDRTKRRIKHAFGHFLAPALVERLAEDARPLQLGGETRPVTIMFSDIAGYTTLAESMRDKPHQLVDILNRYFTVLIEVVERHDGYVVTFIGDAIMGLWGAPASDPLAERHAVSAALEGLEALDAFNRDVVVGEYGLSGIGTRFGIHSGPAVVGNTGSSKRLNYTATGDTTNLAARLEGANKFYGSRLMVSEDTARGLDGAFVLRRLDRLVVKGRREPISVFEVFGETAAVPPHRVAGICAFEAALELYESREFKAAENAFQRLAVDDPTARIYVERCRHYEAVPPTDDWDGSFVSKSK